MTSKFIVLNRVRYAECDMQGVVFNARYGEYVDLAATEYFRYLYGGYEKLVEQGLDTQVVALNTAWKSPARFDDVLAMEVELQKIGNSSFTLEVAMSEYHSKRHITSTQVTYVMVSLPQYTKITIPDELRTLMTQGVSSMVIDYAGVGK